MSWDCAEDYTRAVISSGGDYEVQLYSGQGRVPAERAAVQDLPGRVIYEAVYIPDFFSLRVFALEGRSLQTDSRTVRVGDSCAGERVFVTHGGAAAAPADAEGGQPSPALPGQPQPQREPGPPEPGAGREDRPAPAPTEPGAAPFAGDGSDPAAHVARYAADEAYRQWYDENYAPEHGSICAAVGLAEGCVERHLASAEGRPGAGPGAGPPAPEPAAPPAASSEPGAATSLPPGAEAPGAGGGGCLVATAAYGSELAPQVQALREAREAALAGTAHGSLLLSAFNAAYYAASPAVADLERSHPWLGDAVRGAIAPAVLALSAAVEWLAPAATDAAGGDGGGGGSGSGSGSDRLPAATV